VLSTRQQHCLTHIGITQWCSRPAQALEPGTGVRQPDELNPPVPLQQTRPPAPSIEKPKKTPVAATVQLENLSDWGSTLQAIQACTACELAQSCTRKVPGKGSQQAALMIIGEAPGHDEDLQGQPFVGRAGQLLDKMLSAIDIDPASVYITNILKCRPPNNRDPKVEEVRACSAYLRAQIALVKPDVLLSVGRISAQNLLQDNSPVGQLRGRQFQLPDSDIPLLVTYHPAYLLRNPPEKAKVWEDLKALQRLLQQYAKH
jgi:uracil-DNA glycosylase family 4